MVSPTADNVTTRGVAALAAGAAAGTLSRSDDLVEGAAPGAVHATDKASTAQAPMTKRPPLGERNYL